MFLETKLKKYILKFSLLPLVFVNVVDCESLNSNYKKFNLNSNNSELNQFKADCDTLGFNIGDSWKPIYTPDRTFFHHEYTYKEANKANHTTEVDEVVLQNIYSKENYAFIYRIGVSPKQCRDYGFLGINSNSDNWYFRSIETYCDLRSGEELKKFTPTNGILTGATSLSIGVELDNANLSCGISYDWSELEITSKSDFYDDIYATTYYDGYISNYTRYASYFYGMFTFKFDGVPFVDISHTIKYYGTEWYHENSAAGTVTFKNTY